MASSPCPVFLRVLFPSSLDILFCFYWSKVYQSLVIMSMRILPVKIHRVELFVWVVERFALIARSALPYLV